MKKRGGALILGLGFLVIATGCASTERHPLVAFRQYDYEYAVKGFREEVKKTKANDEKNIVLADLNYAAAGFVGGDYRSSLEGLGAASEIMENVEYGAERGQASMVLAHDIRVFKGEPYERAMAYTYLGLIYFRRGDFENARAAFNLALLADASSKGDNDDYRNDFALAHYMIGKTYLKLNESDNAQISFDKVKKYMPDNPYADLEKIKGSNFTLLVEMGCGPFKRPDPVVGSVDMIGVCEYPERSAEVYLDGNLVGRTAKLVDVNYQATTSGSSARDVAQAAKGAAVTIAKNLPGPFSLIGAAMDLAGVGKADLRAWWLMPGEVHVLEAKIPEGVHTLQLKFFDQAGKELQRYEQIHYYVPQQQSASPEARSEPLYVVRSGLDRHNVARPKAAAYLAGPIPLR